MSTAICVDKLTFQGRLAIQQRVLPAYRAPFFNLLASSCQGGLDVFAGQPHPVESILPASSLDKAGYTPTQNRHFGDPTAPYYLCWQPGFSAWLERWQPDVMIVEANPRYLSTPAAVRWMHSRNRPVLGWGLGVQPPDPSREGLVEVLRRKGRRGALSLYDGMIAYSNRGAEQYRLHGFAPERVFVAINAVAPRPDLPPPERPPAFGKRPTLLFIGRLQERKRLELLLHACAALPPEIQPRVWIVGDGPAFRELHMLAARVYPAAEFTGARHGEQLMAYFNAADLFVLPGTGGLAVQEAMAHGLPVIVAEGDGTQDDLVRPENGWLIPTGDLDALTSSLREALSDANRLRKMGIESYRIAYHEANIQAMVNVFIQALNEIVHLNEPFHAHQEG